MTHDSRVRVELGDRAYDITIGQGLLARAGELLAPHLARKRVFVVADSNVARLHLPALRSGLGEAGVSAHVIDIAPGEASKSMPELARILDDLILAGAERDDLIVAFGGGVVGDLTGLAAGLMKRGAPFVQIPTTLLAQVDSSVGGKTAVNAPSGKNLIGLFNQPVAVLADLDCLDTLPPRERAAGLAEVAKYAFIDDPDFFQFLKSNAAALASGDKQALAEAVRVSCAAKARIVAADETEQGQRALLNLGHTFAHALEKASGFGPDLLHGEAVGAGIAMAFRHSQRLGLCSEADAAAAEKLLNELGLATRIRDLKGGPYTAEALLSHMSHDKKVRDGRITLILCRGLAQAFVQRDCLTPALLDSLQREVAS